MLEATSLELLESLCGKGLSESKAHRENVNIERSRLMTSRFRTAEVKRFRKLKNTLKSIVNQLQSTHV